MKLFFSAILGLTYFISAGQTQVDFNQEVDQVESLVAAGDFNAAEEALNTLRESIAETSLADQDTVKLYFSSKLSFIANQLGDCEKTIRLSKEDTRLRTEIYGEGDPVTLSSKRNLGIYYLNCDSAEQAKNVLSETIRIHQKEIGQPDELYARSLDDLAYVSGKLGELEEAEKYYNELLGLLGGSKNSFYLHVIENYSALLMSSEKYSEAALYYEDLKSYLKDTEDYPFFLKDFFNVFVHEKDYVKALETAAELITWCESGGSFCLDYDLAVDDFVLNSARLSVLLYRYDEAEKYYAKAESLYESQSGYISILLEQANLFSQTNQRYKQLNVLSKSLITHRSQGITDSSSYTKTVLELGKLHTEMGRFERADKVFSDYISDLESSENSQPLSLAVAYQSLGNQRYLRQNFKDADNYFSRAQSVLRSEGLTGSAEYASLLNSQGALYESLANYQKAESNYREALSISQDKDSGLRIALATNLANVLTRTDAKNDSILVLLNQAVIWQDESTGKQHPTYANLLSNRGTYYLENELYELALRDLEKAIQIFEYTVQEDHPQYLASLANLGLLYDMTDQKEPALNAMLKSKELYLKYYSDTHPGYIRTVNNLANHYTKNEQYELAEQLLVAVADIQVKEINDSFTYLSESEKKTFVEEKQKLLNNFKGYIVARSSIDENSIKPQVVEKWYDLELSTKGMLLNSTKQVREQIFNSGDQELIDLFSQWTLARKQIADVQSLKSDLKKSSQLNLDSLLDKTNGLEKELSRRSTGFGGSFGSSMPSFGDIRTKLKTGEATVEIIRTELNNEGIYTALVGLPTKEYPRLIVLGKGDDFERKGFTVYKNAIKFKVADAKSFDFFWRKIDNYLKENEVNKIYYAPDGIYHKISINTLYNPVTKKYLIDDLEILQLSSTKDVLTLNLSAEQSDQISSALLVGRPLYKMDGTGNLVATTRSFEQISNVSELPGTEKEVVEIQSLIEKTGTRCNVLLNAEADEAGVKARLNQPLVHIATHGFFMEDEDAPSVDPMLSSGLLLAGVSDVQISSDQEDGILTAYEIMNLSLTNLKMVVLSACETGLGEIASGEGIYGLQRAFFVGGAESVVMSLWKVDDSATKDLMTTFYRGYLKTGNKRAAFLEAQRKIKKKYKDPIYWGAFVMLGG